MRIGSLAHRDLFCRTFVETHRVYDPETLPWPKLEGKHLELIRAFPFWSFALGVEREAGRMVSAFAQTLPDPVIREAVALQGYEESRHARLVAHVIERFGIQTPEITLPQPPVERDDWLRFGFGECSDSVLGFGGFALARQKQVFPPQLLELFDIVLFEEARHITFFINWWLYDETVSGRTNPLSRTVRALQQHVRAAVHTASGAKDASTGQDTRLDVTSGASATLLDGVTPQIFLELALAENRRMMARLDPRLPKPRIIPTIMTLALLGLRMLPPRKAVAAPRQLPLAS